MSAPAVEAVGLVKRFGAARAVDGLDLVVPVGGVVALLGPNGAGKTTTIRMLTTLLRPDDGTARILGHDVARDARAVRASIGLTGQFASLDDDLSGRENLVVQGRLLGLGGRAGHRADELLDRFALTEAGRRAVKTYSGGMRRSLDIAMSLVVRRPLLFLDEPTTGLDPRSRRRVWEVVRRLADDGTTVLLTTQYLDEADHLAHRIVVVDGGRVVADDTAARLKRSIGGGVLSVELADAAPAARAARLLEEALGPGIDLDEQNATIRARLGVGAGPERALDAVGHLVRADLDVVGFAHGQPSLDEVFLALTGHHATRQETS